MKIRNKLTLLYSLLSAGVLLVFALIFYLSLANDQKDEFYNQIKQHAITKVYFLFDLNIKPEVLQTIYANNTLRVINEEVAIYDEWHRLIYHDAENKDIVKETPQLLDAIVKNKEIRYKYNKYHVTAFTLQHGNKSYIITAAAIDRYGQEKLDTILEYLAIAFCLSLLLIVIAGRFSAEQALKPVSNMVNNVEEITASNLDSRINVGSGKDELAELAITFNEMLNRLEKSFNAQKEFVSNIAHEVRTPLSTIITELELSSNKPRSVEQYQQTIELTLKDAQALAKLTTSLLDLAKASYDPTQISFKPVRIDETLLDAKHQLQKQTPSCHIAIDFTEVPDADDEITVSGNNYLLQVAFANVMENACKFSDDQSCEVKISYQYGYAVVDFIDNGKGIPEADLAKIFIPFYRGQNKNRSSGHGIGMTLCQRIIALHHGEISVSSTRGIGTKFQIKLPHLKHGAM
ncbi:ATP-binding protein [Olivibacter sp. XZL3]|uniref:ATP-binding protein n=1 Tax=Olivibacter sp. XZL3 TaxID=1735116 RepID=UPI001066B049|nr:ATP-binding protein [Olivibacter sp. XZL3]